MKKHFLISTLIAAAAALLAGGCEDGVLTFPMPNPALVRIANVTLNVPRARVFIDSSTTIDINRGEASSFVEVAAGREVPFQIESATRVFLRDAKYSLGGDGRVILFVRGDTTRGKNGVLFSSVPVYDTLLPAGSKSAVIRFSHMAEEVDLGSSTELWITGGRIVDSKVFIPGESSTRYNSIDPGEYSFELREAGTTTVLSRLNNITIEPGRSYMIYSYNRSAALDDINLAIF